MNWVTAHSLCDKCTNKRDIITGKGSRFLLCELATISPDFPKYPRQPVARCAGFVPRVVDESAAAWAAKP